MWPKREKETIGTRCHIFFQKVLFNLLNCLHYSLIHVLNMVRANLFPFTYFLSAQLFSVVLQCFSLYSADFITWLRNPLNGSEVKSDRSESDRENAWIIKIFQRKVLLLQYHFFSVVIWWFAYQFWGFKDVFSMDRVTHTHNPSNWETEVRTFRPRRLKLVQIA